MAYSFQDHSPEMLPTNATVTNSRLQSESSHSNGRPSPAYLQQVMVSSDGVHYRLEGLVASSKILEPGVRKVFGYQAYREALGIQDQHGQSSSAYPTTFVPPSNTDTPESLFMPGARTPSLYPGCLAIGNLNPLQPIQITHERFVRRSNPDEIIVWTDGSCLNNGGANPSAGCGVKYRPSSDLRISSFFFRLETQGPDGVDHKQTSNRAELRAIVAALQFRAWDGEGWKRLVIATDSEYAALGATKWAQNWESNGWMNSKGSQVKNRDLWKLLLAEVRKFDKLGFEIQIWLIPRALNHIADEAAKAGAAMKEQTLFRTHNGTMVGPKEMAVVAEPWTEILDGRFGGTGH